MPPDLHSRNAEARPCAFACQKGLNKPVNGASSFPHAALPGFCSGNGIFRRKNRPARIVHAVAFENSKGFIRALRRVFDSPARSARFPARNKAEERRAFRAENFRNGRFEPSSKAALSLSKKFRQAGGRESKFTRHCHPTSFAKNLSDFRAQKLQGNDFSLGNEIFRRFQSSRARHTRCRARLKAREGSSSPELSRGSTACEPSSKAALFEMTIQNDFRNKSGVKLQAIAF